jgi:hypothetical protein
MIGSETLRNTKFSVEIECSIPREAIQRHGFLIGRYHDGIQVPAFGGREWTGWTVEADSSLSTRHSISRRMVEFVGPVLSGPDGFQEIMDFVTALRGIGCKVNTTCGLHINISNPNLFTVAAIRRLIRLTARHEQALWAINGSPRRERNSTYCRPIKGAYKAKGYDELRALRNITQSYGERYHTLNLQHVNEGSRTRRVEFRVTAGTLNVVKMAAFLRVFTGLVEVAIDGKGKPSWDIIKSERDSDLPDGVYSVRKLFVSLGWKPAAALRSQIHSGNIRGIVTAATAPWAIKAKGIMAEGSQDAAEQAEKSAAILMKLARKYDTLKGHVFNRRRGNFESF